MQKKHNNFISKWYGNIEISLAYHIYGVLISLIIYIAFLNTEYIVLFLCLFIISLLVQIPAILYSIYFGWNVIYADNEKIWQIIRGKKYEWRWDEMTECYTRSNTFLGIPTLFSPLVDIVTQTNYKKLRFTFSFNHYKKFIEICPNETIKEKLIEHRKKWGLKP